MSTRIDTGDGIMIDVASTPRAIQPSQGAIMFKKEDRSSLSMEKRTELFEKITSKSLDTKFAEISVALTDVEKLDDTYNVAMLIDKMKDHCIKYDLHGVFNIVDPKDPATDSSIHGSLGNLFKSYATITLDSVARSNEWYRRWAVSEEYETNLRLSLDFLQRNTTDSLWEKCLEKHNLYPPEQQGGPLIFLIMMKKIQSNTEDAVRYLIDGIQKMKLSDFDGENVDRAVSLLRGAERRLKNTPSGVPQDFSTWVMRIFQTSSVTAFNDKFKLYTDLLTLGRTVGTGSLTPPTSEELYRLAENTYMDLLALDEWTGVTTKGNQSHNGFIANHPKNKKTAVCWNCDEQGHSINDCPKPANNKRIEAKRQAYKEQKKKEKEAKNKDKVTPNKKKGPKNGDPKWAPPAEGESNKRVIDGKPRYWSRRWKKWCLDKETLDGTPPPPSPATLTVAPGDTRVTPRTVRFVDEGSAVTERQAQERQARNVALANTAHLITDALRGLSQSLDRQSFE
jgi:hypothetical protein